MGRPGSSLPWIEWPCVLLRKIGASLIRVGLSLIRVGFLGIPYCSSVWGFRAILVVNMPTPVMDREQGLWHATRQLPKLRHLIWILNSRILYRRLLYHTNLNSRILVTRTRNQGTRVVTQICRTKPAAGSSQGIEPLTAGLNAW